MKKSEISESNKLIAEFMGYQYEIGVGTQPYGWYNMIYSMLDSDKKNPYREYLCRKDSEMKYHSSWDWLMPVIAKIYALGHPYEIYDDTCDIHYKRKEKPNLIDSISGNYCYGNQLMAVYQSVVGFIKWSNENKK